MFPVRYFFGGLLFLKPLGTFLTMLLIANPVNGFCEDAETFSSENI